MPALLPEPPQRAGCFLRPVGVAGLDRPLQRDPNVGVVFVTPVEPPNLVCGGEMGFGLEGEVEEVLGVAPARAFQLAGRAQLLQPELPDRLQHGEPGPAPARVRASHQRLIDQGRQSLERIEAQAPRVAHRLRRLDRPAPGENREPREERSFG
jgi:hypothetical protein